MFNLISIIVTRIINTIIPNNIVKYKYMFIIKILIFNKYLKSALKTYNY